MSSPISQAVSPSMVTSFGGNAAKLNEDLRVKCQLWQEENAIEQKALQEREDQLTKQFNVDPVKGTIDYIVNSLFSKTIEEVGDLASKLVDSSRTWVVINLRCDGESFLAYLQGEEEKAEELKFSLNDICESRNFLLNKVDLNKLDKFAYDKISIAGLSMWNTSLQKWKEGQIDVLSPKYGIPENLVRYVQIVGCPSYDIVRYVNSELIDKGHDNFSISMLVRSYS